MVYHSIDEVGRIFGHMVVSDKISDIVFYKFCIDKKTKKYRYT